jgi:hypothetical protein
VPEGPPFHFVNLQYGDVAAGERQSLWYPSLGLVYQERVGDWGPVLAEAGRLLRTARG